MSTSTQTSCYVMVILGWGWVGWGGAKTFMSTCTHTSCYVMVTFSCTCTHTHTSCYVMVNLGLGGVGWGNVWRSCQLAHTRHATLWLSSLALAHTRHATLRWSSLALAHTRHATLWLAWGCLVDLFFNRIQPLIRWLYRDSGMVRPGEDINIYSFADT